MQPIVKKNKTEFSPRVQRVVVDITTSCNARCVFCANINDPDRIKGPMWTVEQFHKILDQIAQPAHICFCSAAGEPFLNQNIEDMLKLAKSKGHQTSFFTNGASLNNHERLLQAIQYTDNITWSFIDPDPEINAKWMRRTDITHIEKNISFMTAQENCPTIEMHVLLMRDNLDHLTEILSFALKMNVKNASFTHMRMEGVEEISTDILTELTDKEKINLTSSLEEANEFAQNNGIQLTVEPWLSKFIEHEVSTAKSNTNLEQPQQTRLCTDPWRFLNVYYSGNTSVCCYSSNSIGNSFTDENVNLLNENAKSIQNSLLTGQLKSPCLNCDMRPMGSIFELKKLLKSFEPKISFDERMNSMVSSIKAKGLKEISIYGAGKHTHKLLENKELLRELKVICIYDDHKYNTRFNNIDVFNPELTRPCNSVLISSDTFENQLKERAENLNFKNIFTIYN